MKMENKEKFLQFISEAIDNGANIGISFYSEGIKENEAEEKSLEFSNIVGGEVTEAMDNERSHRWFKVRTERFDLSVFHDNSNDKKYMMEDVGLSEKVKEVTVQSIF
jgi:hypothetical protein